MKDPKFRNNTLMVILTLLLGAVVGLVLWLFLQAVSLGSTLIWDIIPGKTGQKWLLIPLCAGGGALVGLLHRRFGDYPEELDVVMGKVKKEKHYDYHPMLVMLICAALPLIFGSSVGPEAGLTGIIAGLCYWIGDNVSFAKQNASLYSELGEAVTLGQLFHMPLFGIFAVEEVPESDGKPARLPKLFKLLLYGLSALTAFLVISGLNHLFKTSVEGFPSFSEVSIHVTDYVLVLLYVPVGIGLFLLYSFIEKKAEQCAEHVPVFYREIICGAAIGVMSLLVPMVLFSGEEQLGELMNTYGNYAPLFLIGICLLKIFMTAFCLRFGMKGGHFFPLIFACACMGFALAMLFFPEAGSHVVFAAGVVTSATLGAQLKKPLAVSVLMLLCFPVRLLFWIFLAAVLGAKLSELLDKFMNRHRS